MKTFFRFSPGPSKITAANRVLKPENELKNKNEEDLVKQMYLANYQKNSFLYILCFSAS